MTIDQKIFTDGHVARTILRDFAERPDEFDEDVVEEIWQHLDECEHCIEDFEAIRDGEGDGEAKRQHHTEEPPEPATGGDGAIESDAFEPEDLKSTKVNETEEDEDHINGLMPVGDDPTRNGLPDEYRNGERRATVTLETETAIDAASDEASDEDEASEDAGESKDGEGRRQTLKAPEIDGLITGEVCTSEAPADRLETESAVEAGKRITQEESDDRAEPAAGVDAPDTPDTDGEKTGLDNKDAEPEDGVEDDGEDPFIGPAVEPKPTQRPAPPKPVSRPAVKAPPTAAKKQEPLEDLLNKALALLTRPRNAIIFGAVIVLIAGAIVSAVVLSGNEKESLVAGWEPLNVIETSVPLQEVIVRTMRRGRIPRASGPDVTLDFRGVDRLVIAVDLDFINNKALHHDVIVRDPSGANVYQEQIPQLYLDDGRFFLRLVPEQFEINQTYKLELASRRADGTALVIAESVFDVTK